MEETGANTGEAAAEAVVTLFNEAWSGHDLAAALALTSEDCVFESTSPAPDGQRAVGRAAVRAAWQPIFADLRSGFTVEETFTAGCRVVQRWRYDWGDGHVRGVDLFTVQNGRVTEKMSYVKGLPGTARAGSRRVLVRHTFRPTPQNEYTCAGGPAGAGPGRHGAPAPLRDQPAPAGEQAGDLLRAPKVVGRRPALVVLPLGLRERAAVARTPAHRQAFCMVIVFRALRYSRRGAFGSQRLDEGEFARARLIKAACQHLAHLQAAGLQPDHRFRPDGGGENTHVPGPGGRGGHTGTPAAASAARSAYPSTGPGRYPARRLAPGAASMGSLRGRRARMTASHRARRSVLVSR